MRPAGIILAAGESRRMGSDKALLDYRGETFLEHLIRLFLPRVEPLIVVLGHHAEKIRATIEPRPGLVIAVNPGYHAGQFSSLQTGIRALPANAAAALVTLVDHPAVAGSTLDAMLHSSSRAGSPPLLLIPRYQGRRGHPVLFARPALEELAALPPTSSAKQVVHGHPDQTVYLDLADPSIVRDIDHPSDYQALVEAGR